MRKLFAILAVVSVIAAGSFYVLNDDSPDTVVKGETMVMPLYNSDYGDLTFTHEYPTITFTATAKPGYTFAGWYSGETCLSESATLILQMSNKAAVRAVFTADAVNTYTWSCPVWAEDGSVTYKTETLALTITSADFVKAQTQFDAGERRYAETAKVPTAMVSFTDPYVVKIADHLTALSAGMTDAQKATVILRFVQDAIAYATDISTYSTDEYWATPVETLYGVKGDCEDTAVLLCSIAGAMGMETGLVAFDHDATGNTSNGHMGSVIALPAAIGTTYTIAEKNYVYCETATDNRIDLGSLSSSYNSADGSVTLISSGTYGEYIVTSLDDVYTLTMKTGDMFVHSPKANLPGTVITISGSATADEGGFLFLDSATQIGGIPSDVGTYVLKITATWDMYGLHQETVQTVTIEVQK